MDPTLFETWIRQAETLLRTGDPAAALLSLRRAAALRPDEMWEWRSDFTALEQEPEFRTLFGLDDGT